MKDREFYAKLVFGARWKKVEKFLASGELEEKTTIMEAFGAAAKSNDECYNHLVEAVQKATSSPCCLQAFVHWDTAAEARRFLSSTTSSSTIRTRRLLPLPGRQFTRPVNNCSF